MATSSPAPRPSARPRRSSIIDRLVPASRGGPVAMTSSTESTGRVDGSTTSPTRMPASRAARAATTCVTVGRRCSVPLTPDARARPSRRPKLVGDRERGRRSAPRTSSGRRRPVSRTMPVTLPSASTSAPPDDAELDAAPVSRRPPVVGPVPIDTRRRSTRARRCSSTAMSLPGRTAPTTQTVSPGRAPRSAGEPRPVRRSRAAATRDRWSRRDRRSRADWTTPSDVVTLTCSDDPTRRLLVRISLVRRRRGGRTHTPEPRLVPDSSWTLTVTTERRPTAIATTVALDDRCARHRARWQAPPWCAPALGGSPIAPTAPSTPSVGTAPTRRDAATASPSTSGDGAPALRRRAHERRSSLGCIHSRSSGSGTAARRSSPASGPSSRDSSSCSSPA